MDLSGKTQDDVVAELRSVPMGGKVKMVVSRQEDVHMKPEVRVVKINFCIFRMKPHNYCPQTNYDSGF